MAPIIQIQNITKEFKVLNRREGLKGSLKDLFSRDYKIVRAVDNVSMSIEQGEIVGYLGAADYQSGDHDLHGRELECTADGDFDGSG